MYHGEIHASPREKRENRALRGCDAKSSTILRASIKEAIAKGTILKRERSVCKKRLLFG